MDVERIAMFAGVGFALGVGAFVLWGPVPKSRRRGQIGGITNLGHTCFLNSLLQSLASMRTFKNWLNKQSKKCDSASFTSNLVSVIDKINGFDEDLCGDVTPIELIDSLGTLWRFGPGHQDTHELFHVILSALQNETRSANASRKGCCLSDALPSSLESAADTQSKAEPSVPRSVSCNDIALVQKNLPNEVSMQSVNDSSTNASTRSISNGHGPNKPGVILARSAEIISRNGVERDGNGGSFRAWSSLCAIPHSSISVIANETHPFSGLLTSQLRCTNCMWKSPVRYDKLESVSLPLPPAPSGTWMRRHTLAELLSRLVANEIVHNVRCDGCSSQCPAIKTLTLGKLPRCLCLHIPRTTWSDSGVPIKRDDPVIFPETLLLDPFTFAEATKRNSQGQMHSKVPGSETSSGKHRYTLRAVVEHRGPVDAGHFVSYRRGNKDGQWIYASDTTIDDTTLSNVLCASPYLLFYERKDGASG